MDSLTEAEWLRIRDDVAHMRMRRELLKQIGQLRRELDDVYETVRLLVERYE